MNQEATIDAPTDAQPQAAVAGQVERSVRPPFPKGCTIRNIRRGDGFRSRWVYACLYGPDDKLLISATLDYINDQLLAAGTAA